MGFFDKVSDAIITAEMVFEKECRSFTCYGLDDITKNVEIKGKIIDKDNNLIQFSGNILVETKSLYGKKFLIDDQNKIMELDLDSVETKMEEVQQKTKTAQVETSIVKFNYRKLELI